MRTTRRIKAAALAGALALTGGFGWGGTALAEGEVTISHYFSGELGRAALPAPVYVVGSWNEEFEGHCIWPFDFNLSVPAESVEQHGFDISMALKEVFGWNHYAFRDIGPAPPAGPIF